MNAPLQTGNALTLLENGSEFFPALCAAIQAAQREIHLETYIFADDDTGRAVATALARAARRGLTVRLLVDGFGSAQFMASLGQSLLAEGVHVLVFRPERKGLWARLSWRKSRLRRLHRKLAVIDGKTAFIGGINVVDDWDNLNHKAQVPPRFDYAVQLNGPLVEAVHHTMRRLWQLVAWSQVGRRTLRLPPRLAPLSASTVPVAGTVRAALLIRDNLRHRRDIEDAYLDAFARAEREILIANAYFLPGRRFLSALLGAAQRGVRVRLLLQGQVEYWLQHRATQSLYARLLAAGIEIYEYRRSFLHAKVAVIDDRWATVGSSNIDPFSLLLAREANVLVEDENFAVELRASLEQALRLGGHPITAATAGGWSGRLAYGLLRLAASFSHHGAAAEYR